MAFPDTPLGDRYELLINGAWTDITSDMDHGPATAGRGHPDESTQTSPATLGMTITNTAGKYTSKNPVSPLYPYLMRNVQARVSVPAQNNYLRLEAGNRDRAFVQETASLDITGSVEMRIQLRPSDWRGCILAAKWDGNPASWFWQLNGDGTMSFTWADSGGTLHSARSAAAVSQINADVALRVTMNAATGGTAFGTAAGISGPYTQLGPTLQPTFGAATSIRSGAGGNAPLVVGWSINFSPSQLLGRVDEFQLWNGLAGSGGSLAADAVFSAQAPGTTSWTDAQGNAWNLAGGAEISSRSYRLHAEVPEWPQKQDRSNKTILVSAAGGGLLRRIGQRNNPVSSAMNRAYTRLQPYAAPVAYWPMEDGQGATQLGAAIGTLPMYFSGSPQLAANSDFACSAPLPVCNGATFSGQVPAGGTWTDNVTRFLMEVPSGGEPDQTVIASVQSAGTVAALNLRYGTGGSLYLVGWDASNVNLFVMGPVAFGVNGQTLRVSMSLQNTGGGNIEYSIQTLLPGASSALTSSGTIAGTIGRITQVTLNPSNGLTQTVFGHCSVQPKWDDLFDLDGYHAPSGMLTGALSAWQGEPAAVRFARLCGEEGIQVRIRGNQNATAVMGPQASQTVTQLLQECVDADRGMMTELRQQLGFGYICQNALYNQPAAVTVDYDADDLAMWTADPLEDDQTTVNDASLAQTAASGASAGATARQFAAPGQPIAGGRLSTLSPPNGVGTYDQSYSVNLANAPDLNRLAAWIVHRGTVDQPRYPGICLDLTARSLSPLFWQILEMDLGDRIVINNPPVEYGPDPISQIVQQVSEELWSFTATIGITGVPEQPYEVAAAGTSWKADTAGSALTAAAGVTATTLTVASAGAPWTTAAGDPPFDLNIAGERVTVTAVGSGLSRSATSPSAFQQVVNVPIPPGTWLIGWTVQLSGTAGAPEADNFQLAAEPSGTRQATSVNPAAAGTYPQQPVLVTIDGVTNTGVAIRSGASAATSGAVYTGTFTSPQALTVTRSVNGVSKSQAAGAAVALWQTPVAAL